MKEIVEGPAGVFSLEIVERGLGIVHAENGELLITVASATGAIRFVETMALTGNLEAAWATVMGPLSEKEKKLIRS